MGFNHRKALTRPVEARSVHLDHRKVCRRTVEAQRVGFDHRQVCNRPVEARFYYRKACTKPVESQRMLFDHLKRLGESGRCILNIAMRIAGLKSLGVCVSITKKHEGSL